MDPYWIVTDLSEGEGAVEHTLVLSIHSTQLVTTVPSDDVIT